MEIFNRYSTRKKRKNLRKNQTDAEAALWRKLRCKSLGGHKFFRQYGIGKYIVDFYCPKQKLVIEVDGSGHYSANGEEYDRNREIYMSSLGIRTIRFSNIDVLQNMDGVLTQIDMEMQTPLNPLFTKEGKE